jgi:uncharacterized phage protein gp47/JayE
VAEITIRGTKTIRDNYLRTLRNGLARIDIDANVTPGSDWYVQGEALANQLVVCEANGILLADRVMPDTTSGDELLRGAATFGITLRSAEGSVGSVVFDTAAVGTTVITEGDRLIDGAGLTFEVATTGPYSDGDSIPIRGVDTGEQTNHDEDDVLRWVSTPTSANEKALVASGGLVDGTDADDEESLRARWISVLQDPPATGNSGHVAVIAEESSSAVQKAFSHPALLGAGTFGVVVVKAPTTTNKSREVAGALMTSTVEPYVDAEMPDHTLAVTTTVEDVNADVAFGLVLPEAPTANPPGPGGGWLNGSPWPAPDASTTWRCTVTGVTSSTVFIVDATTSPTAYVSKISWLSPYDWTLYTSTVVAVSGTSGAYTITIDIPFPSIATGCHIWPACVNAQDYVDAVLTAFALMGPGEKTANSSLLTRAYRRPRPAAGWPYTLGGHLTRAVADAAPQDEIDSIQFFHRTDGTTTLTGSAGTVTPQLPATTSDPPLIFVPRHISFYRVP